MGKTLVIEIRTNVWHKNLGELLSEEGHEETFRVGGNVLCFHLGDGYTGKNSSNNIPNICSFYHIQNILQNIQNIQK